MTTLRSSLVCLVSVAMTACGVLPARNDVAPSGPVGTVVTEDGSPAIAPVDAGIGDASNAYTVALDGSCDGETGCSAPIADNAGCGAVELCGADGKGNGLDDNCDGRVDETCSCTPGAVEPCFLGPPGKHHVGACTDGTQTCEGSGEFGSWGGCQGSISPHSEACDHLDNDCNGCIDDGLCCAATISCPAPGDPRIADQAPYTNVPLIGSQFYIGEAQSWSWTITGGPCDQLFASTTSPVVQSFSLSNPNSETAEANFTLSGDYTVTMTVTNTQGSQQSCTWVQHIAGPGLRFELCWDHSGDVDLDLHVHEPNNSDKWFQSSSSGFSPSAHDCDYANCKAENYGLYASLPQPMSEWNYSTSPLAACLGSPSGAEWHQNLDACANPRLDIDNIFSPGVPENINIDHPKNGQTFRALVHDYSQNGLSGDQHPLMNIYCAGRLMATYGQSPNQLSGFNDGGGWAAGSMWRVADVTVQADANGNTTGCDVNAIHPPSTASGYYVTDNDTSF